MAITTAAVLDGAGRTTGVGLVLIVLLILWLTGNIGGGMMIR